RRRLHLEILGDNPRRSGLRDVAAVEQFGEPHAEPAPADGSALTERGNGGTVARGEELGDRRRREWEFEFDRTPRAVECCDAVAQAPAHRLLAAPFDRTRYAGRRWRCLLLQLVDLSEQTVRGPVGHRHMAAG